MNWFKFFLYYCLKIVINIIFRLFYRIKIVNPQAVKSKGGVLLVGNHSGWFDTLFLTCAVLRPIWFVTGDFILNVPVFRTIVKHLCIIPMTQKKGLEGIQNTIKKLQDGYCVCIFPEGTLTRDGEMQRFRNGVAKIQKATNLPIVPFYMQGSFEAWSHKYKTPRFFRKITITFGNEFYPKELSDSDIANEIKETVQNLLPS